MWRGGKNFELQNAFKLINLDKTFLERKDKDFKIQVIYKLHGNHKAKTYGRYTKDKERNLSLPLKKVTKLLYKEIEWKNKGTERNNKTPRKQLTKWE